MMSGGQPPALRTTDRSAAGAARQRLGDDDVGEQCASAGAIGSVRNTPADEEQGVTASDVVLANAGTNKAVAMMDETTTT